MDDQPFRIRELQYSTAGCLSSAAKSTRCPIIYSTTKTFHNEWSTPRKLSSAHFIRCRKWFRAANLGISDSTAQAASNTSHGNLVRIPILTAKYPGCIQKKKKMEDIFAGLQMCQGRCLSTAFCSPTELVNLGDTLTHQRQHYTYIVHRTFHNSGWRKNIYDKNWHYKYQRQSVALQLHCLVAAAKG